MYYGQTTRETAGKMWNTYGSLVWSAAMYRHTPLAIQQFVELMILHATDKRHSAVVQTVPGLHVWQYNDHNSEMLEIFRAQLLELMLHALPLPCLPTAQNKSPWFHLCFVFSQSDFLQW
jgi:hypothetical protein